MVENGSEHPVALVFGPENGAVSERSIYEAAREAYAKSYVHLYVIGFAIQPNARRLIEECESAVGISATWVAATPDLMMGDLLKTMRSSQIFSVCGLPDIRLSKLPQAAAHLAQYEVRLRGLDIFDPITMTPSHLPGDDVPAWLLDTDYNGLVFHGSQVFFPRNVLPRPPRQEKDTAILVGFWCVGNFLTATMMSAVRRRRPRAG